MEYEHFTPPETPAEYSGPKKEDILRQIESDHYDAVQNGNDHYLEGLDERHAAVKSAESDEDAYRVYNELVSREPETVDPQDVPEEADRPENNTLYE